MSLAEFDRLVLERRPWGYWIADDMSGALRDRSGNGRDMSATGSPQYRVPLGFNGAIGVRLPSGSSFATSASLSMSGLTGWTAFALVRPLTFPSSSTRVIYHNGDDFGVSFGFGGGNQDKLLAFNRSGGASYQEAQDVASHPVGESILAWGSWDATSVYLRTRGSIQVATASGTTNGDTGTISTVSSNSADFVVGRIAVFTSGLARPVTQRFYNALLTGARRVAI